MRILILAAIAAFAFGSTAHAAACRDPATHKFIKCAPAATALAATPTRPLAATPTRPLAVGAGHPHCVKGKVCGNSCIAMSKVCHKPA